MKIDLGKNELIHFVGIGGIGMSGLALIMNGLGYKVQGSDISDNKNITRLREKKIKVFFKHKKENIKKTTVLVISSEIFHFFYEVLPIRWKVISFRIKFFTYQGSINKNFFIK